MAVKKVDVPNIGTVSLYKRKGARNIRLSVSGDGQIRVSLPYWLPYAAGTNFALSKRAWILSQRAGRQSLLRDGQQIGKAHHLYFLASSDIAKPTSRIKDSTITVTYQSALTIDHPAVQQSANNVSFRALRLQAEKLLPGRLDELAKQYDFSYGTLAFRRLKGRWGSCDSHQNITLNIFLMQLPWELIDYVLLHELTHTKVLQHGPKFWAELEQCLPDARKYPKQIREYRPIIGG